MVRMQKAPRRERKVVFGEFIKGSSKTLAGLADRWSPGAARHSRPSAARMHQLSISPGAKSSAELEGGGVAKQAPKERQPFMWLGFNFTSWVRLLWRNRFSIHPSR